ncbi:MAG: DUF4278 domain-containing protein [Cyanobacteria bacterium Co-bin13]|nr:DUF4278 domain-containing protein [Cyanobacteria bacterium Co-bin13]
MELRYRGISYVASAPGAEGEQTGETGTFLGAHFDLRRYPPQTRLLGHKGVEMRYRGIRYTR